MRRSINIKCHCERPKGAWQSLILGGILLFGISMPAAASYLPFNTSVNMNVGIGTSTPQGALDIKTGNNVLVESGNVGIGSLHPGQLLDVQGTARITGFTLTGNGAANGNVLVSNSVGIGTWMPASALGTLVGSNYWLNNSSGNIGISTAYAVGIGTTFVGGTGEAALSVMNGNVGIGTWLPASPLTVEGNISSVVSNATAIMTAFEYNGPNKPGIYMENGNSTSDTEDNLYVVDQYSSNGHQVASEIAVASDISLGDTNEYDAFLWNNPALGYAYLGSEQENGNNVGGAGLPFLFTTQNNDAVGMYIGNNAAQNVGIGTTTPVAGLAVMNGNVGIGTWVPGFMLDIKGTARMTGFVLSGNGAANGNVLVGNSVGVGTWMPASTLAAGSNYWLLNGGAGNVGINTIYAVGIGTSFVGGTGEAALSVMNGNVGIGTWAPSTLLQLKGSSQNFYVNNIGNVGIGSISPQDSLDVVGNIDSSNFVNALGISIGGNNGVEFGGTTSIAQISANLVVPYKIQFETGGGAFGMTFWNDNSLGIGTTSPTGALEVEGGNVGIGTWAPGGLLDVKGTARMTGFVLTGNGAANGNVLVGNGVGVGTWMPASSLSASSSNYWLLNGGAGNVGINTGYAVGIGTSFVGGTGEAAFAVMNGNVGIGTWLPGALLQVGTGANWLQFATNGQLTVNNNGIVIADGSSFAGGDTYFITGTTSSNWEQSNGGAGVNAITVSYNTATATNVGINTDVPMGALEIEGGNVGIGTTKISTAGLTIMNGNVGIGTWVPGSTLQVNNTFTFQNENNIGSQAGAFTVNWAQGNKQKVTLTGSGAHTATFTAPTSGVSNLMLKVVQSGASNTVTWPAAVKWPSASTPTLTTVSGQEDLMNCYYDGADYLCTAALNYTP